MVSCIGVVQLPLPGGIGPACRQVLYPKYADDREAGRAGMQEVPDCNEDDCGARCKGLTRLRAAMAVWACADSERRGRSRPAAEAQPGAPLIRAMPEKRPAS